MPLIEWNETYSVGIKKIDDQHRKFFSLINVLFDAMKAGKGEELVDTVLKELQQYANYHFEDEEALMKRSHYPGLENHILEHRQAVIKIHELRQEFERKNQMLIVDMLKFLHTWLQDHILESDRKYIPYVKE